MKFGKGSFGSLCVIVYDIYDCMNVCFGHAFVDKSVKFEAGAWGGGLN